MNEIWLRSIGIHQRDLAKISRGVWERSGSDPYAPLPSPQGEPLTKILHSGSIIPLVWILQGGRDQGKGGCSSGGGGGGGGDYKVHLPPGVSPHKRNECSPAHSITFSFGEEPRPRQLKAS